MPDEPEQKSAAPPSSTPPQTGQPPAAVPPPRAKITSNELLVNPFGLFNDGESYVFPDQPGPLWLGERSPDGYFCIRGFELGGATEAERRTNENGIRQRYKAFIDNNLSFKNQDAIRTRILDDYNVDLIEMLMSDVRKTSLEYATEFGNAAPGSDLGKFIHSDEFKAFAATNPENLAVQTFIVNHFKGVDETAKLNRDLVDLAKKNFGGFNEHDALKKSVEIRINLMHLPDDKLASNVFVNIIKQGKPLPEAAWNALMAPLKKKAMVSMDARLADKTNGPRKAIQDYAQEHASNPYERRLPDAQAADIFAQALDKLSPEDRAKAEHIAGNKDVTIVIIPGRDVKNYLKKAGGFWSEHDKQLYLPMQGAEYILRHEVEHALISEMYSSNRARPWPASDQASGRSTQRVELTRPQTRQSLFQEAVRMDLERMRPEFEAHQAELRTKLEAPMHIQERAGIMRQLEVTEGQWAMARLRADVGISDTQLYPQASKIGVEFIPYLNDQRANNPVKWAQNSERYFFMANFIKNGYEKDVAAHLAGQPLPVIDAGQFRREAQREYEEYRQADGRNLPPFPVQFDYGNVLRDAPRFIDQDGNVNFSLEHMGAQQRAKVEDALQRIGLKRSQAGASGEKPADGYIITEQADLVAGLRGKLNNDATGFVLQVPAQALAANPQLQEVLTVNPQTGNAYTAVEREGMLVALLDKPSQRPKVGYLQSLPTYLGGDGNLNVVVNPKVLGNLAHTPATLVEDPANFRNILFKTNDEVVTIAPKDLQAADPELYNILMRSVQPVETLAHLATNPLRMLPDGPIPPLPTGAVPAVDPTPTPADRVNWTRVTPLSANAANPRAPVQWMDLVKVSQTYTVIGTKGEKIYTMDVTANKLSPGDREAWRGYLESRGVALTQRYDGAEKAVQEIVMTEAVFQERFPSLYNEGKAKPPPPPAPARDDQQPSVIPAGPMKLGDYLKQSARRDGDGSWNWAMNDSLIPVMGRGELDAFVGKLTPEQKANVVFVPVSAWYKGSRSKAYEPSEVAEQAGKRLGIPVNTSVVKLNHTNATASSNALNPPSLIVSPAGGDMQIKPGQDIVLIDDTIATAGTLRDYVRHANKQGARVIGVVETNSDGHTSASQLVPNDMTAMQRGKLSALQWVMEQKAKGKPVAAKTGIDALMEFRKLPQEERAAFTAKAEAVANQKLAAAGLNVGQLTWREMAGLNDMLEAAVQGRSSVATAEQFWERTAENARYPEVPEVLHAAQELAARLGFTPPPAAEAVPVVETPFEQTKGAARQSALANGAALAGEEESRGDEEKKEEGPKRIRRQRVAQDPPKYGPFKNIPDAIWKNPVNKNGAMVIMSAWGAQGNVRELVHGIQTGTISEIAHGGVNAPVTLSMLAKSVGSKNIPVNVLAEAMGPLMAMDGLSTTFGSKSTAGERVMGVVHTGIGGGLTAGAAYELADLAGLEGAMVMMEAANVPKIARIAGRTGGLLAVAQAGDMLGGNFAHYVLGTENNSIITELAAYGRQLDANNQSNENMGRAKAVGGYVDADIFPPQMGSYGQLPSAVAILKNQGLLDTTKEGWDRPANLAAALRDFTDADKAAQGFQSPLNRTREIMVEGSPQQQEYTMSVADYIKETQSLPILTAPAEKIRRDQVAVALVGLAEIEQRGKAGTGQWSGLAQRTEAFEAFQKTNKIEADHIAEMAPQIRDWSMQSGINEPNIRAYQYKRLNDKADEASKLLDEVSRKPEVMALADAHKQAAIESVMKGYLRKQDELRAQVGGAAGKLMFPSGQEIALVVQGRNAARFVQKRESNTQTVEARTKILNALNDFKTTLDPAVSDPAWKQFEQMQLDAREAAFIARNNPGDPLAQANAASASARVWVALPEVGARMLGDEEHPGHIIQTLEKVAAGNQTLAADIAAIQQQLHPENFSALAPRVEAMGKKLAQAEENLERATTPESFLATRLQMEAMLSTVLKERKELVDNALLEQRYQEADMPMRVTVIHNPAEIASRYVLNSEPQLKQQVESLLTANQSPAEKLLQSFGATVDPQHQKEFLTRTRALNHMEQVGVPKFLEIRPQGPVAEPQLRRMATDLQSAGVPVAYDSKRQVLYVSAQRFTEYAAKAGMKPLEEGERVPSLTGHLPSGKPMVFAGGKEADPQERFPLFARKKEESQEQSWKEMLGQIITLTGSSGLLRPPAEQGGSSSHSLNNVDPSDLGRLNPLVPKVTTPQTSGKPADRTNTIPRH